MKVFFSLISLIAPLLFLTSCVKVGDVYQGDSTGTDSNTDSSITYSADDYLYPFGQEATNVTAEITIKLNEPISDIIETEVPALKYNKSLLFMLTQDDCKQAAYCCTWAAINGKPLTNNYFYNSAQLKYGDLPPDSYSLGKTLGSTDGAGHEVRFSFTTTLLAEDASMNLTATVQPNFTDNYYRFFMKSSLIWSNVREMLNYGVGIAFHDVNTPDINNPSAIQSHYIIAQDSILSHLSNRGCKMLAEPNGNEEYIVAAQSYDPIQTLAAQKGEYGSLYPFKEEHDLKNVVLKRLFADNPDSFKELVETVSEKPKQEREAIYAGVHLTTSTWASFLEWLNDNYGQDGDDSLWFPSQEEYYEYTYYRVQGTQTLTKIDDNTLKLTVTLPSDQYFYYPSITVNLKGLDITNISSMTSTDAVTGLSYGTYDEGTMVNIDCRKFLVGHATHYVEKYEQDTTDASAKADAIYFINMLKESVQKTALLDRVN